MTTTKTQPTELRIRAEAIEHLIALARLDAALMEPVPYTREEQEARTAYHSIFESEARMKGIEARDEVRRQWGARAVAHLREKAPDAYNEAQAVQSRLRVAAKLLNDPKHITSITKSSAQALRGTDTFAMASAVYDKLYKADMALKNTAASFREVTERLSRRGTIVAKARIAVWEGFEAAAAEAQRQAEETVWARPEAAAAKAAYEAANAAWEERKRAHEAPLKAEVLQHLNALMGMDILEEGMGEALTPDQEAEAEA